ncbi:MAG: hypothetical protein E7B59_13420 [Enterobacteriaceae bacterium]|nr:hypothetical protein [Enterobacteriaceae bacterium]
MSAYNIYNILSGMCIGALFMTWLGFFLYLRQERRHREDVRKMQQQVVTEIKNAHRDMK